MALEWVSGSECEAWGLGMGLGLRGIGMGLRGVGIGIRGGKAPMGEAALAEEEDGYYRLIVTDLSRVSA